VSLGGNSLPQRPIQALIAVEKDNDSDALPGGELKWGCSRNTLSLAMATYSWVYLDKTVFWDLNGYLIIIGINFALIFYKSAHDDKTASLVLALTNAFAKGPHS
jgi:hypothetical protein